MLTAHPTEVQRKSTLDCELEIARLSPSATAYSSRRTNCRVRRRLRRVVLTLWQTRILRESRLTVNDEIENGLSYYVTPF